jgi:hypothetical protein
VPFQSTALVVDVTETTPTKSGRQNAKSKPF